MQYASATILVAFATGMWIAGQRFIQYGASKRPTPVSILESALPCGDLAMTGDDRIGVTRRKVTSCRRTWISRAAIRWSHHAAFSGHKEDGFRFRLRSL